MEEEEEEDESDPDIPWGALLGEDEQADVGQANRTPIPQHAPAQTEKVAPLRSAREDASPRSEEQVHPASTNPIGGSKQPIADVVESESSDQPLKCSWIMALGELITSSPFHCVLEFRCVTLVLSIGPSPATA